jgi:dTDP-4-dehydrorhamnose 3,5-epimerase
MLLRMAGGPSPGHLLLAEADNALDTLPDPAANEKIPEAAHPGRLGSRGVAVRFTETELGGVWLIEPVPNIDDRGSFTRTFCEKEMADCGLATRFVQHSQSHSVRKGTLRGMHFQKDPYGEVKIVSCIRGAIYDVVIDLRPTSPTRHKWTAYELTAGNKRQLYIPAGFAHGFQTLTEHAEVSYLISQFYTPHASMGVRYDDPAFAIDWPMEPSAMSERDSNWPHLDAAVVAE